MNGNVAGLVRAQYVVILYEPQDGRTAETVPLLTPNPAPPPPAPQALPEWKRFTNHLNIRIGRLYVTHARQSEV